jgi:ATP-dependent DNA helicase RecG
MTPEELKSKLRELMNLPAETEWVEFKEAKNNFDFDELGRYFSALSNEANLKGQSGGWLIFGVTNKPPRQACGSSYRSHGKGLSSLKSEIAKGTNHQITFIEIHEVILPEGRVVMFEIPPAARGIPTEWRGQVYGRHGESLGPLSLQEIDQIRRQVAPDDWSSQTVKEATIADLDPDAIAFAKLEYRKKFPHLTSEIDQWDEATFLNKAKVCISGKITRTALILLGRNESEHFLSPAVARITWVLKDTDGNYMHFGPPLILAVDKVLGLVRNLTYRHMPEASLFPIEIPQYDKWVMRETLHNCIAHQEYPAGGRINVVEESESLLFTNVGDFLPGTVEAVIRRDAPPEIYRNRFLAEAMVNLGMIDTIGSGIKRIFQKQRDRNFPMPDYDLTESQRVKVRIFGKVIDENYTRMLLARTDLNIWDVIALDKVQKGKPVTAEEIKALRKKRLVEGRRPNYFVSAEVAAATETRADYIKKRGFDRHHYKKMVLAYLGKFRSANRNDLEKLLLDKLSDSLTVEQKKTYVMNLLQEMRREKSIQRIGGSRGVAAKWALHSALEGGSIAS